MVFIYIISLACLCEVITAQLLRVILNLNFL